MAETSEQFVPETEKPQDGVRVNEHLAETARGEEKQESFTGQTPDTIDAPYREQAGAVIAQEGIAPLDAVSALT